MTISRRTFTAALGAMPAAILLPRTAFAAWPERPVHLIVPFAAGGNADIVGRLTGDQIAKGIGGTVVVENRGGAGGSIGAAFVARAAPDGYTLLVGSNGPLTVNPLVQAHLEYEPQKDLAPVALTSYVPHAIIVTNSLAAKTLPDFIAHSKKQAITMASSGVGSATHMTLERFKAATGADITHVPYRSGGALMPDLMGGSVQSAMTEFSTALPLHKGGKARIIAVAAVQRSRLAPDIATFIDGGVKDFTASSYIGVLAPAKTPAEIIATIEKAIRDGLAPGGAAAERLASIGAELATPEQMTAKGFAAFIKDDAEKMKEAAKLAGLKPQ
jgi:tripartite-type tricarboxylate transporter receptor subunit TctC